MKKSVKKLLIFLLFLCIHQIINAQEMQADNRPVDSKKQEEVEITANIQDEIVLLEPLVQKTSSDQEPSDVFLKSISLALGLEYEYLRSLSKKIINRIYYYIIYDPEYKGQED